MLPGTDFLVKGGFRKALVVVQRQDVVAVARDARFRIGLPWSRPRHAEQRIRADRVIAFDFQARDERLRPFHDMKCHEQVVLLVVIMIVDGRADTCDVAKAVRKIHGANRIRVSPQQLLAEAAARGERRGLQLNRRESSSRLEILVAIERHTGEAILVCRASRRT